MSKIISCGILLYRITDELEVFLVKPGGVYNKNALYGIAKGHLEDEDSSKQDAAIREFLEETGANIKIDRSKLIDLDKVNQNKNKIVYCWAYKYDLGDKFIVKSNMTTVEYPKKSGNFMEVPEIDNGKYFPVKKAKGAMIETQFEFVKRLIQIL